MMKQEAALELLLWEQFGPFFEHLKRNKEYYLTLILQWNNISRQMINPTYMQYTISQCISSHKQNGLSTQ